MSAVPASFSYGDALRHGWRAFTANIGPMALYALVVIGVSVLVNIVFGRPDGTQSFLGNLVGFLVNQLITIGWLRIALDAVDGRPIDTDRIRNAFSVFVPFLVAAILFSLGVTLGLILLIVPGIIFAVVFGFYGWALVDGAVEDGVAALRHSAEITRGNRWQLFGFGIVLLALNLLGLLALVIGVVITSAVSILALAHVYRQLSGGAPTAA
jgi:uncharacterized membrane protein